MKYVLTGGPNCGKTSVINELRSREFNVLEEVAREVLSSPVFANTKNTEFLEGVIFAGQLCEESKCDRIRGIKFLDRGLPDVIAYCWANLGYVPKEFTDDRFRDRYEGVFLLDRLPFVQDGVRIEKDDSEAQKMHDKIIAVYRNYGYSPVNVPIIELGERGIGKRADFIVDYIENLKEMKENAFV